MTIPASVRRGFGKFPFFYQEIDIERCAHEMSDANTGTGACTAVPHGNDALYSEDLSGFVAGTPGTDTGWGAYGTGATVLPNAAVAPDGTTTADELTFGSTGSIFGQHITMPANTNGFLAVWLRAVSGTFQISVSRTNAATWLTAAVSGLLTLTTEWTRVLLPYVSDAGDTLSDLLIGAEYKTPNPMPAVGSVYVWGFQHVKGTTSVPYYCKTTSAAVAPTSGSPVEPCYRCRKGCQDAVNYAKGTPKTMRLLQRDVIGVPVGFEGYPVLDTVDQKPTVLAQGEGLASRERLDIRAIDLKIHDRDMDPYWQYRATPAAGTLASRFRRRNPYYIGWETRYYKGFIVNGAIDPANFDEFTYIMHQIDPPSQGIWNMQAYDRFKLATKDKAQVPAPSTGSLAAALGAADLSLTLTTGTGSSYRLRENLWLAAGEAADFTDPAWVKSSSLVVTANAGNDIWGNAVADTLDDTSNAGTEFVSQAATDYVVTEPYCVQAKIEKDAIGRATRFPVLRLEHAGSTTETSDISLDTMTGEYIITTATGAVGDVIEYPSHWLMWIQASSSDAANTGATGYLLPAAGADAAWAQSAAATGSVTASDAQIERNASPGWPISTTVAAVKNGMKVLVNNEVIKVTDRAVDTLSWPDVTYRAQDNTKAATGSAPSGTSGGDSVQWCEDVTGMPSWRALAFLPAWYTPIAPKNIPFASWEAQKTNLGAFSYIDTGLITKSTDVIGIMADIAANSLTNLWPDSANGGNLMLEAMQPKTPVKTITSNENILEAGATSSLEIKDLPDKRISMIVVNYGLTDPLNPTRSVSYNKHQLKIGNQLYGVGSIKEIHNRWFSSDSAITTVMSRMSIMYFDTPIEAHFDLESQDLDVTVASAVDINDEAVPTDDLTGAAGSVAMMVISRQIVTDPDGNRRIVCVARPNPYTGRYGLIAPTGTPPYSSASAYEQGRYMFIGYNSGALFPDGSPVMQIQ